MKEIKTFAWLGVGLVALASALALYNSISGADSMTGYYMAWVISILGTIIVMFAGFISRPRFFWLVAVATGIFYTASLYGWLVDNTAGFTGVVMVTLPGVLCITTGVLIKRTSSGKKSKR